MKNKKLGFFFSNHLQQHMKDGKQELCSTLNSRCQVGSWIQRVIAQGRSLFCSPIGGCKHTENSWCHDVSQGGKVIKEQEVQAPASMHFAIQWWQRWQGGINRLHLRRSSQCGLEKREQTSLYGSSGRVFGRYWGCGLECTKPRGVFQDSEIEGPGQFRGRRGNSSQTGGQ